MIPALQTPRRQTVSRLLSVLAVISATVASAILLLPNPLADVFFSGIVLLSVLLALVGAIGAWTNRTPFVWVAALLSTGLSVLGLLSIGIFLAPAALLLLGAAIFSQLAGPRPDVREAIVANPPTEQELVRKKQVGTGAAVVGVGLVYVGAFAQELFSDVLVKERSMPPFLVAVLETDEGEAFIITKSVREFDDCVLGVRSFGDV